jgi:hypothetical protein
LDLLFRKCSEPPISGDKLKLLHASHRLFEVRANYFALALEFFASSALATSNEGTQVNRKTFRDVRKRAAALLLSILRRVSERKVDNAFLSSTVLPTLIQRVSAAFTTLDGPEKFVLLECILVAGKALPSEQDRSDLTRTILSEPFQTFASLKDQVFSRLLEHETLGTAPRSQVPWQSRGYFVDVEVLPLASKQFCYSLMTLSTCSQDGQLTAEMWAQLVPLALEVVFQLDSLWANPSITAWALIIHPVDAICLMGGRMAETMETFVEGLDDFGDSILGAERCAVLAFLSSARSCALELLKNAWTALPGSINVQQAAGLLSHINTMEHRHLAILLGAVPFHLIDPKGLFEQLIVTLMERLRMPRTPAWSIRPFPNCSKELFEDVDDAAYAALEIAFAKLLRLACPLDAAAPGPSEAVLTALCERLASKDIHTVRHAAATIHERCFPLNRLNPTQMSSLVMRGCLAGMIKSDEKGQDSRPVFDLTVETLSRLIFGIGPKELGKVKQQALRGTNKGAWITNLSAVLGNGPVAKFSEEMNGIHSEKAFKGLVQDLMEQAIAALRSSGATGAATSAGGDLNGPTAPGASSKRNRRKKNKNKSGEEMQTEDNKGAAAVGQAQPSWHDATSARDLGTLLLFGAGDDDDL